MRYTYRGDRITDPGLRDIQCDPVRRADGKCVRGRNGNMLVVVCRAAFAHAGHCARSVAQRWN